MIIKLSAEIELRPTDGKMVMWVRDGRERIGPLYIQVTDINNYHTLNNEIINALKNIDSTALDNS